MTNDITAGSFVSVSNTKQSSTKQQSQQTVLPSDSFKIVAKIANSQRLSETEKSGLISNVALIEKYATGSLRTRLLNDVTATTIFLENTSGNRTNSVNANSVNQAVQQFKQTQQVSPPASQNSAQAQRQVESVQSRVENFPAQTRNTNLTNVKQQVSTQEIQAVFSQSVESAAGSADVNVRQVPTLAESRQASAQKLNVQDDVVLSLNAQVVQEIALPGGGSGETAEAVPLPGSGSNVEIPVLGSGDFEEIPLPGGSDGSSANDAEIQADIAARIARLESLDVPEIPLPGGVNVSEIAAQIEEFPEQAIESIGEVVLPGQGSESANGSVNEQAARVALSI